jgi:hypothetical protein
VNVRVTGPLQDGRACLHNAALGATRLP